MEALIKNHQILPGNIFRAVKQRIMGPNYINFKSKPIRDTQETKRPQKLVSEEPSAIQIKIGQFEKLASLQNVNQPQKQHQLCKRATKKLSVKNDGTIKKDAKQVQKEKDDFEEDNSDSSGIFSMDLSE